MRHLGDITKLRGGEMPAVDVITGGSPCQDLSVAGTRKGLAGERSGLFMEQIRIVKEMRDADRKRGRTGDAIRPRYLVWENVLGAISSNKGRDYQQVLTEIVRISEPDAPEVPFPDKGGWPGWDVLMGDGWSVAWRIHDARFWGVPQRRRRICVLADFGGWTAGEILLDPELRRAAPEGDSGEAVGGAGIRPGPQVHAVGAGLSGDSEPGGAPGEETAGDAGDGAAEASGVLNGWDVQSKRVFDPGGVCGTLNSGTTEGMNMVPSVLVSDTYPEIANALTARYDGSPQPDKGIGASIVAYSIQGNTVDRGAKQNGLGLSRNVAHTLDATDRHGVAVCAAFSFDSLAGNSMKSKNPNSGCRKVEIAKTLDASVPDPGKNQGGIAIVQEMQCANPWDAVDRHGVFAAMQCANPAQAVLEYVPDYAHALTAQSNTKNREDAETYPLRNSVVRRLTPLECTRLQGYPDGWVDIGEWTDSKGKRRKPADAPMYKALGNSIALPFWRWLARRIVAQYVGTVTMGSLFDGIGGFPLVFAQSGAVPVWASEVEEFCIAVTKRRFGDDDAGTAGDWRELAERGRTKD